MGAVKAFLEAGYEFRGVTGTSIGAINGALIAQGDFEAGYRMWESMDLSLIFDFEANLMKKAINRKIDKNTIAKLSAAIRDIIENRGINTAKIRRMLDRIIDEDKLRQSETVFGIVTVSVSDLKPLELYKEDIPAGKMSAYLMASANFPVFRLEPIDGKYYLDGGFYDNCPINLLIRKGFREIIAVRTMGIGLVRKIEDDDVKVTNIFPSEDLGKVLNFNNQLIQRNLKMGYYDAMRAMKGLKGRKYYLKPQGGALTFQGLLSISEDAVVRIGKILALPPMEPKRMLFEKIIPVVARWLKLPDTASHEDVMIGLLEYAAAERGIEKYHIYHFPQFVAAVKSASVIKNTAPKAETNLPETMRSRNRAVRFSKDAVFSEILQSLLNLPESNPFQPPF